MAAQDERKEDVHLATSKLAWSRAKSWSARFKVISCKNTPRGVKSLDGTSTNLQFSSESFLHGKTDFSDREQLRARITDLDRLIVECSLSDSGTDEISTHAPFNPLGELLFDNPEYADVVFVFPGENSRPERRIYASKAVLARGSSVLADRLALENEEADPIVLVDPSAVRPDLEDHDLSDEEDMGALDPWYEKRAETSDDDEPAAEDEPSEPTQDDAQVPTNDSTAESSGGDARVKDEASESIGVETRNKKRRKTESSVDQSEEQKNLRRMVRIEPEHPFVAFRALIAFLHTNALPFTPLPSDYIVARADAIDDYAGPDEDFSFPSRADWLRAEFYELRGQPDWQHHKPCSPHALYKIARALKCKEAAEIALSRIVRSLTVENAIYELVSPLSQEFRAVELAVFPFFRQNYTAIKATYHWEDVVQLLCDGKLPSAQGIFAKMLKEMDFPKA